MKKYKLIRTGILPTNTYVLYDTETKKCVIIDPAYDASKVVSFVEENNFDLQGILLTHGHFDHCGGVERVLQHKYVGVYGSSLDAYIAQNASKNQWGAHAKDCTITHFVEKLLKFTIGDFEFEVIETPGHTEGSLCYLIDGLMFSGDTLFDGCVGRTDLPGGDGAKMMQSLRRLSSLNFDYVVLPGHENTTTLSEQKIFNPYLRLEAFDYD